MSLSVFPCLEDLLHVQIEGLRLLGFIGTGNAADDFYLLLIGKIRETAGAQNRLAGGQVFVEPISNPP